MLVITCPHCRAAVVPQTDGTCPACRRAIPPALAEPFVIQSGYGVPKDRPPARQAPVRPILTATPSPGENPSSNRLRGSGTGCSKSPRAHWSRQPSWALTPSSFC